MIEVISIYERAVSRDIEWNVFNCSLLELPNVNTSPFVLTFPAVQYHVKKSRDETNGQTFVKDINECSSRRIPIFLRQPP